MTTTLLLARIPFTAAMEAVEAAAIAIDVPVMMIAAVGEVDTTTVGQAAIIMAVEPLARTAAGMIAAVEEEDMTIAEAEDTEVAEGALVAMNVVFTAI